MAKSKKEKAHAERMTAKARSRIAKEMSDKVCTLMLLSMYGALSGTDYGFDQDKLNELHKDMTRIIKYIRDGVLTYEEAVDVLSKNGIDPTKIGDY